jgi:hypothetical protein
MLTVPHPSPTQTHTHPPHPNADVEVDVVLAMMQRWMWRWPTLEPMVQINSLREGDFTKTFVASFIDNETLSKG